MAPENPGRSKLTELMPYHVFGNVHAPEIPPVMNEKGLRHELRNDRTGAGPGLDGGCLTLSCQHLLVKLGVHIRPLFQRSTHNSLRLPFDLNDFFGRLFLLLALANDVLIRLFPG